MKTSFNSGDAARLENTLLNEMHAQETVKEERVRKLRQIMCEQ